VYRRSFLSNLLWLAYLVIGLIVASNENYLKDPFGSIEKFASAVLAVLLWPLLLFDVDLRINSK
jgi:hypothetical protein